MSRKRTTKPQEPARDPVHVPAWVFPPPTWTDRDGALEHLGDQFAGQLRALADLVHLGGDRDLIGTALEELSIRARAVARAIAEDRPAKVDAEAFERLPALVAAAQLVRTKTVDEGFDVKAASGVTHRVDRNTLPTLAEAASKAAMGLAREGASLWDHDQEAKRWNVQAMMARGRELNREEFGVG